MNCPELELLIRFAYRLLEKQEAAQVSAHLGGCPRCRDLVAGYQRLDAVMDEWKPAGPSPWFDTRVRLAVDREAVRGRGRGFGGLGWAKGLALASLALLVVAGAAWMARRHHTVSNTSASSSRPPGPPKAAVTPPTIATLNPVSTEPATAKSPAKPESVVKPVTASSGVDQEGSTVDDDDLLANFEVLSELRKGPGQVAN